MRLHLLYALGSAWLYAGAVLLSKRALDLGVAPRAVTLGSNLVLGLIFLPWLASAGPAPAATNLAPAVLAGLLFLAGQFFTFRALASGDVSVATPALAAKVVMVALLCTWVLGDVPHPLLWVAVVLTMAGVVLLHHGPRGPATHGHGRALLLALLSACCFALTDIVVQWGGPRAGFGWFVPVMFGTVATLSLGLVPRTWSAWHRPPREGLAAGAAGVLLMGLQAVGMAVAIGLYRDATGANVVYSSRGLWSLLLLAWIGPALGLREVSTSGGIRITRWIGCLLILTAVLLVLG